MCGDDKAVRNGGEAAKGTEGTRSAYTGISANGRCRGGTERQAFCIGVLTADSKPTCPCSNP